jgi:hypothetical protein
VYPIAAPSGYAWAFSDGTTSQNGSGLWDSGRWIGGLSLPPQCQCLHVLGIFHAAPAAQFAGGAFGSEGRGLGQNADSVVVQAGSLEHVHRDRAASEKFPTSGFATSVPRFARAWVTTTIGGYRIIHGLLSRQPGQTTTCADWDISNACASVLRNRTSNEARILPTGRLRPLG